MNNKCKDCKHFINLRIILDNKKANKNRGTCCLQTEEEPCDKYEMNIKK